jgi:hypothetical protein
MNYGNSTPDSHYLLLFRICERNLFIENSLYHKKVLQYEL